MSLMTKVKPTNLSFDIRNVVERALTKPKDGVISIKGSSGLCGISGANGVNGSSGYNGSTGSRGGDGDNGSRGYDGEGGTSGSHAQHGLILLSGTIDHLNVQLKTFLTTDEFHQHSANMNWDSIQRNNTNNHSYDFQMFYSRGIILVEAYGGSGGGGGNGGNGGHGGAGGHGGMGQRGQDGRNGWGENDCGGNGGNGGSGGSGGRGGNGGDGGQGGDAGHAGAGGHIQIRSADPRLFMLMDGNCLAGVRGHGGKGGSGGQGGSGGSGGSGGAGGNGGRGGSRAPNGKSGCGGASGCSGSSGYPGRSGRDGLDGRDGIDGSILYAVVAADGHIIETGSDKYHATVISYLVMDDNNDGIYEPNSDLYINNVEWINNGALSMPSGAIVSFPSTSYIQMDANDISILPSANINETFTDPHQFKCHIRELSTVPINKSYIQPIKLTSEINLLNRPFSGSMVETTLICQYPVQVTHIGIPTFLGPNERAIVTVTFKNISKRSYGDCSDSAGTLEFTFSTHRLIKIMPMHEQSSYEIISDNHARYKINEEITSDTTKTIMFTIMLDADSARVYYESLFWQVDLLLRDKTIEKRSNGIRVVPTFTPDMRTDVLLVTNSKVNRAEFLAYQNLFRIFNYTSQTWSMERYGTFDSPEVTWLGTTDLIIFIYSKPESTFQTIRFDLLLRHIHLSEKAGFICIGACSPDDLDFALFDYTHPQFLNDKERVKAEATDHAWTAFGCGQPTMEKIVEKANKLRPAFEKPEDHRFLYQIVYSDIINPDAGGIFTVVYGNKYVYKSTLHSLVNNRIIVVPTNNPLITTSHLPFIIPDLVETNEQGTHVEEISTDIPMRKMIQSDIDLNSRFGRILCAILSYQGFQKAYAIIPAQHELVTCVYKKISARLTFHHLLAALFMSTIEREYDRGSAEFSSSEELVGEISNILNREHNSTSTPGASENGWLYLLIQSLYEYIGSKFFSSFPWCCGCSVKSKQRSKLQHILNDLLSLASTEISKNKQIFPEVKILRLHQLADLKFPVGDVRENCFRSLEEIQSWQRAQIDARILQTHTTE